MRPSSITRMRSQDSTVASRCAMTIVVRCAHQIGKRGGDLGLAFGVERRGRLVEQQQRRIAQNGARDGDALALATRQRDAALADRRVESVRQRRDEGCGMGMLGGARDIGIGCAGSAEADIVAHRGREHHAVLRHQRDTRTQIRRIEIGERDAVERDAAGGSDRRSAAEDERSCSCRRRTVRRWQASRLVAPETIRR